MKTRLKVLFALWIAAGGMISAAGAKRSKTAVYVSYGGDAAAAGERNEAVRSAAGDPPTTDTLYCRQGLFREHDTLFPYRYAAIVTGIFRDYCDVFVEKERDSRNRRRIPAAASLGEEENRRTLTESQHALRRRYPGPMRRYDCEIALLEEHLAGETLYRLPIAARKACLFDLLVRRSAEMPAGNEIRKAGAETFRRWIETFHSKQTPSK